MLRFRNSDYRNIELFDYQKLVIFGIFANEVIYALALYFWNKSGMDAISWSVAPIQQILYIIAENEKSMWNCFIIIITAFSINRNRL